MSDLTTFLLAQIAEDETFWRREVDDLVMGGIAERVLAECEAKRRIVKLAEASYEVNALGLSLDKSPLVRALAQPHADHPDYREEWKP